MVTHHCGQNEVHVVPLTAVLGILCMWCVVCAQCASHCSLCAVHEGGWQLLCSEARVLVTTGVPHAPCVVFFRGALMGCSGKPYQVLVGLGGHCTGMNARTGAPGHHAVLLPPGLAAKHMMSRQKHAFLLWCSGSY
jgi:hypothetical protein